MLKIRTASGKWDRFCTQILDFLQQDIVELEIDGQIVRGFRSPDSPALWIRDHSDILRAGRYLEPDVRSAVDCFANAQARNGRIFDHVLTSPLRGSSERENWEKWVRVPVEADVEFRFVKAAYLAWQATGDRDWLFALLPALDQALSYLISHPLRWEATHQLIKRPYTIDTWDFDYTAGRHEWLNFQITADTFWGIFHGDNSGFYEAAILLSRLFGAAGDVATARTWQKRAHTLQKRANALLFNGRFYTHFYKLVPVEISGVDESEQLSLSTPMAINRGMATHENAVAILQEYRRRRETGNAFAEWYGIDPPFPDGIFGDEKLVAGAYINGGIFPLAGGELAKAAFEHGFEKYGVQTLAQYRRMIADSGAAYLWYFPDGRPSSQETSTSPEATPTDGWGSSAMLYGFIEGLAGVTDLGHSFQRVRLAPRWPAAGEEQAEVEISYASSGAAFVYGYEHAPARREIALNLPRSGSEVLAHVLLPAAGKAISVQLNGEGVPFQNVQVEKSTYVNFALNREAAGEVVVRYADEVRT